MSSVELQNLLNRIRREHYEFPAAQRLVAAYVVENYSQIPFMSITELAKTIGVSDNTVVKFCNDLGFNKFGEFKKAISNYVHSELVMLNKFCESPDEKAHNDHIAQAMEEDMNAIQNTLNDVANKENIPKILNMIEQAEHIYITGGRSSAMLAGLFASMLRYLELPVYELNCGVGDYIDRLSMVKKQDLVIAITLPRYTAQIVKGVQYLHEHSVPVALITDTGLCPAQPYADLTFHCNIASDYYFPCLSGCLSLIGLICRAESAKKKEGVAEHIQELEKRLLDQGIFI